jgi:hypothetical protein
MRVFYFNIIQNVVEEVQREICIVVTRAFRSVKLLSRDDIARKSHPNSSFNPSAISIPLAIAAFGHRLKLF